MPDGDVKETGIDQRLFFAQVEGRGIPLRFRHPQFRIRGDPVFLVQGDRHAVCLAAGLDIFRNFADHRQGSFSVFQGHLHAARSLCLCSRSRIHHIQVLAGGLYVQCQFVRFFIEGSVLFHDGHAVAAYQLVEIARFRGRRPAYRVGAGGHGTGDGQGYVGGRCLRCVRRFSRPGRLRGVQAQCFPGGSRLLFQLLGLNRPCAFRFLLGSVKCDGDSLLRKGRPGHRDAEGFSGIGKRLKPFSQA